ncbi:conserved hypothetical protein [Leishmania major strain Friedlin]|uniref:Uncharacterized protein n=1 Tax=Leishmania major TaxID=5664 RepID=Q4Q5A4_LEIMA|nr:conserved hypothetical protein [Leishmania major strain Friedlin]CAG9580285.1 hypothetical_protein_-_conserved [Leishmania major strain Friedlin]CAJ08698.1 conserved hypothetical protein [Leishmania major strain Friedlin]|eukprot:XP_001685494.1 conserved hypothetical protein [Leishmania major strain Friedlin]
MRVGAAAISAIAASPFPVDGATKAAKSSPAFPMRALVVAGTHDSDAVEGNNDDEAIFELFFREAQLHYHISAEENMRNHLLAGEEVAFTNLMIEALQARAELLAGDEAAELVIRDAQKRAQERQAMMKEIEKTVALRLHDERMAQLLAMEFEALLPAHGAGCERILREEAADLGEVFRWHKENRPLGAGCFIEAPVEDSRLTDARRGTGAAKFLESRLALAKGSRRASCARSSRVYLAQLLQKGTSSRCSAAALGPLAVAAGEAPASLLDGTLPVMDEALFQEEGRARLQAAKDQRYLALRGLRAVSDIRQAAAAAREKVLAEEAMCWMQIARLEVDGIYAAQEATRERKKREASADAATTHRAAQKKEVKERLLRQRGRPVPEPDNSAGGDARVQPRISGKSTEEGAQPPKDQAAITEAGALEQPSPRSSSSTVPDNSPLCGALAEGASTTAEANVDAVDELAYLRFVTGEITDPDACKQLSALVSSEVDEEVEKAV